MYDPSWLQVRRCKNLVSKWMDDCPSSSLPFFNSFSWVMGSLVEIHAGRAALEALTVLKWQCGAHVC